jgi:hypothetical protein
MDPATLSLINAIDLSTNPTSTSSELVVKENTLDYGLYKFNLQVVVTYNLVNQITSNLIETFVQIIPTGLAVFAIQNGVSSVLIGSNQVFSLQPSIYTIDMDNIITADKLSFTYYCKTVNLSDPNSVVNSQTDLMSYKSNPNLVMSRNQTCFGLNSEFFFKHKSL